jgi:hypothetical protein
MAVLNILRLMSLVVAVAGVLLVRTSGRHVIGHGGGARSTPVRQRS